MNFLEGLVAPDGRIHGADWAKLSARCGYTLRDIEVNSDSRLAFPPEPELDRRAAYAGLAELRQINVLRLGAAKLSYFWLSFDQAFETQDMRFSERIVRLAGVCAYWFFLAIGLWGWRNCKRRNPGVAQLFIIYAIVVTCLHLPFAMTTRIRTPLVEPAIAILVGLALAPRLSQHEDPLPASVLR